MRKVFYLSMALLMCMLSGCAIVPTYQLPKNVKNKVKVNISELSDPFLFINDKEYTLSKDQQGNAWLPADSSFYIGNNYTVPKQDGYYYLCAPMVKFDTYKGTEYLIDFNANGNQCEIAVLSRASNSKKNYQPVYSTDF